MKDRSYIIEAIDLLIKNAEPKKKPWTAPKWLDYSLTILYLLVLGWGITWGVQKVIDLAVCLN